MGSANFCFHLSREIFVFDIYAVIGISSFLFIFQIRDEQRHLFITINHYQSKKRFLQLSSFEIHKFEHFIISIYLRLSYFFFHFCTNKNIETNHKKMLRLLAKKKKTKQNLAIIVLLHTTTTRAEIIMTGIHTIMIMLSE